MRGESQRRTPVIPGRNIQKQEFPEPELSRAEHGLYLTSSINSLRDVRRCRHVDVGNIKHVRVFQRRCFRIIPQFVYLVIVYAGPQRNIQREIIPFFLIRTDHVPVSQLLLVIRFDIPAITPGKSGSRGGIKFLTQFIG